MNSSRENPDSEETGYAVGEIVTLTCEEHLANARLIAAAPELLAATQWFLSEMEAGTIVRDITKDGDPDWSLKMLRFVSGLQKAQTAVAKATQSCDTAAFIVTTPGSYTNFP